MRTILTVEKLPPLSTQSDIEEYKKLQIDLLGHIMGIPSSILHTGLRKTFVKGKNAPK